VNKLLGLALLIYFSRVFPSRIKV